MIRIFFNCRKNVLDQFYYDKKEILFKLALQWSKLCSNGASYLFVNGTKIYKFKAKDSEIVATPLCLGKFQKIGQQII